MKKHALKVVEIDINKLHENPANTRRHNEYNVAMIARSLEQYGQRKPVVVQKKGMIVRAGNGLLTAAKKLKWKKIAAVVIDESSIDATGYEIMDNRSAEISEWDDELLVQQLSSLADDEFDLLNTGFSQNDLDDLMLKILPPDMDSVPDVGVKGEVEREFEEYLIVTFATKAQYEEIRESLELKSSQRVVEYKEFKNALKKD